MEKKVPMRTCISCKAVKPKKELYRIVKSEDGIFLDKTGRKNGRGAYVCNDINCIKKLKKGRLLSRAFSCEVEDAVYDGIEKEFSGE